MCCLRHLVSAQGSQWRGPPRLSGELAVDLVIGGLPPPFVRVDMPFEPPLLAGLTLGWPLAVGDGNVTVTGFIGELLIPPDWPPGLTGELPEKPSIDFDLSTDVDPFPDLVKGGAVVVLIKGSAWLGGLSRMAPVTAAVRSRRDFIVRSRYPTTR